MVVCKINVEGAKRDGFVPELPAEGALQVEVILNPTREKA
jgi:hypothetical protein